MPDKCLRARDEAEATQTEQQGGERERRNPEVMPQRNAARQTTAWLQNRIAEDHQAPTCFQRLIGMTGKRPTAAAGKRHVPGQTLAEKTKTKHHKS